MTRSLALAALLSATASLAQAQWISPLDYPQPDEGTDFLTVVEIPQGSFTKYELNTDHGYIVVDRYQSMPVIYPGNYGSIPSSIGGDGDPLDAIIYTREPIVPGAVIKGRPIGILHMIDGGEEDAKIVAVPASDIDPTYDDIQDIADLPAIERQRLEQFFAVYKNLPEGRKKVELSGFGNADEAKAMIATAFETYKAQN